MKLPPQKKLSKNVIDTTTGEIPYLDGRREIHMTHAKDISGPPAPPRPKLLPPTIDGPAYAWKNSRH